VAIVQLGGRSSFFSGSGHSNHRFTGINTPVANREGTLRNANRTNQILVFNKEFARLLDSFPNQLGWSSSQGKTVRSSKLQAA
jgi:hypothetical protein